MMLTENVERICVGRVEKSGVEDEACGVEIIIAASEELGKRKFGKYQFDVVPFPLFGAVSFQTASKIATSDANDII
jgi:hypothetical protein